jgi:iron complex outermembrane receptor protein
VFEPMKDLSMEVGYFSIKITDGIKSLSGDDIPKDWYKNQTGPTTSSSVYANRLIKNAQGYLDYVKASLENVVRPRRKGFDLSAKYRVRTDVGTFTPVGGHRVTRAARPTS